MNNFNIGYDCRNNIDNCTFASIYDELDEISYLKKYQSFRYVNVGICFMWTLFNNSRMKLKLEDEYYDVKKFRWN